MHFLSVQPIDRTGVEGVFLLMINHFLLPSHYFPDHISRCPLMPQICILMLGMSRTSPLISHITWVSKKCLILLWKIYSALEIFRAWHPLTPVDMYPNARLSW